MPTATVIRNTYTETVAGENTLSVVAEKKPDNDSVNVAIYIATPNSASAKETHDLLLKTLREEGITASIVMASGSNPSLPTEVSGSAFADVIKIELPKKPDAKSNHFVTSIDEIRPTLDKLNDIGERMVGEGMSSSATGEQKVRAWVGRLLTNVGSDHADSIIATVEATARGESRSERLDPAKFAAADTYVEDAATSRQGGTREVK